MFLTFKNLTIRNASEHDAVQLAAWWNDGKIMAHAGFPNGIGQTAEQMAQSLRSDADAVRRRLIIEMDAIPIGEMSYRNAGNGVVEIGIKICDFSLHNKGLGKVLLSMLISALFQMGYVKIILDTNFNNRPAQHVYEALGFRQQGIRKDAWRNQLGELQTSIDYALIPEDFVNFIK